MLPAEAGRVALPALLEELGTRQVQSLLVEGGAETLGTFFDQRAVDQFYFFYAPKILGGQQAREWWAATESSTWARPTSPKTSASAASAVTCWCRDIYRKALNPIKQKPLELMVSLDIHI